MPKGFEQISQDAVELSRPDRLRLAQILLDLDRPADAEAEAVWDAEIGARLKAYDEGLLPTHSYEEVRERMRGRLQE